MLVDQIEASKKRLDLSMSIKNADTLKKDLEALYLKLIKYESQVLTYMKNIDETKKALGISVDEKSKIVNTLKRFCDDSLTGKRDLALQDLQNLENDIKAGNKELRAIWDNFRSQSYSSRKNLVVALLNIIEDERQLDKLGELRTRIEAKQIGDRKMVSDIEEFCMLTDKLIETWKMEQDVQEFVKQLARGEKIYLCQITKEILMWIKENKLDKKVVLSLKSEIGN